MKESEYLFNNINILLKYLSINTTKKSIHDSIEGLLEFDNVASYQEILLYFGIKSVFYKISIDELKCFEYPILAYINDKKQRPVILLSFKNNSIEFYCPITGINSLEYDDFRKLYLGFILAPILTSLTEDPNLNENRIFTIDKLKYRIINYFALSIVIILFYIHLYLFDTFPIFHLTSLMILKLIGVFIVSMIVKIELNIKEDKLIRKICINDGCNRVINSNISKIFSYFSLGDLGVIYYSSSLTVIIIGNFIDQLYVFIPILAWINVFTLPFTFLSIIIQKFKLNTWCPLCLSVLVILWLEFVLYFKLIDRSFIQTDGIIFVATIHILVFVVWIIIKRIFLSNMKYINEGKILINIKRNIDVFYTILSKYRPIDEIKINPKMVFGNINSQHQLIIIVKFDCDHCLAVVNKLICLLEKNKDILGFTLIFNISNTDIKEKQKIQYLYNLFSINEYKKALNEWASLREKGHTDLYCNFIKDENNIFEQNEIILKQLNIISTPSIIYNLMIVPFWFDISDIIYLIKSKYIESI